MTKFEANLLSTDCASDTENIKTKKTGRGTNQTQTHTQRFLPRSSATPCRHRDWPLSNGKTDSSTGAFLAASPAAQPTQPPGWAGHSSRSAVAYNDMAPRLAQKTPAP
ncbi:hypothetical protein TREES_T100012796 [Tupaia chinensis]|uniref:Uncharacterized protein n=1 Tax=Tupaia chinensis TaxID=246437 RepID=L9LCG1_TUPCH|nr:hypothetical protein TREES_T100012796 [Tupaia chinensis]